MLTVALYNFKGGAFKTTGTYHLASGLAMRGYRVLVVDTDPQAHATLLFGISINDQEKSPERFLFDYLTRPNVKFQDVAKLIPPKMYAAENASPKGHVVLIPGNDDSAFIANRMDNPTRLRTRLQAVANHFDFCLVDTPPTPSLMSTVTYTAIDAVLYPTMCVELHIDGLMRAFGAREGAKTIRQGAGLPPLKTLGILPAIFRENTLEHRENLEWIKSEFGANNVWEPISAGVIWEEASRLRLPVFTYAPESKAAQQAFYLVDEFLGRIS